MSAWPLRKLGDVCEIIAGQSPPGSSYNADQIGVPFYQGKKEFGTREIGSPTTWTSGPTKIAEAGDILMSVRAPVGPVNLLCETACIGRGLAAIRAGEKVDRDFLFYNLLMREPEISGTEGAVFASINRGQIAKLEIALPPLNEQRRIVAVLDEAFAAIATATANAEKNLANARELFESFLSASFENLEAPRHSLSDACERVTVGHVGTTSPHYRASGIPFLRTQNVTKTGIRLDDLVYITPEFHRSLGKSTLRAGDVLISRVITDRMNVGVVPFNLAEANCANVICVRPGAGMNPQYLLYLIRTEQSQRELLGRRKGSAQQVVNTTVLKNWRVPVPRLEQQDEMVARLDAYQRETDDLIARGQRKLSLLANLKQSLLHRAFSGELNEREPLAA